MFCPFCSEIDTKVIDSRLVADGHQVRRRRECLACKERYTTFETAELVMPKIIKRDGSREPFNEDKMRNGLVRALEKRPVSVENVEQSINRVKSTLRASVKYQVKCLVIPLWSNLRCLIKLLMYALLRYIDRLKILKNLAKKLPV